MNRQTISLCMIVKNEEKYLERCLKSVEGIVDEIIIIDTGSTDRTIEIAESYGAQIHHFQWVNDFSKARNESLKHATSEYILVLDADEYVDSNHNSLKEAFDKDVYYISIKSLLRGGISTLHPVLRLFKNCPQLRFTGRIHEQINIYEGEGFTQNHLKTIIHHDGYLREVIVEKNKEDRNLEILLADLKEQETGFGLFNLGIQYKMMGKYELAIMMFEKAYPQSIEFTYISKLITSLIQCYMELEQYNKALIICNEAIGAYPVYTDLYYLQGQIYESLNYYNDACKSFNKCLLIGEVSNHDMMTFHGVGSYMAMTSLGEVQFKKGEVQQSIQNLTSALKINKHYMPAIKLLFDIIKTAAPNDGFNFVVQLWPISSVDDLKEMIGVLYKLRQPLLYKFSELYEHNVDDNIKTITFLYNGQYDKAKNLWLDSYYSFDHDHLEDILLYSIVSKDRLLIDKYKREFPYREKDMKLLFRIIERAELLEIKWTNDMELLLVTLFEKLIILREFDTIDYFVNFMKSYSLQFGFAKHLAFHGFNDIAFNIMELQLPNMNREGLVWVADQLAKEGNDEESLKFYDLANDKKLTFDVLESSYQICIKNQYNEKAKQLIQMMRVFEPTSVWATELTDHKI